MHNVTLHISKTLIALAVLVLPLQQSLLSACCCDHDRESLQRTSQASAGCCSSQADAGCCAAESGEHHACCEGGGTEPCRCSHGGCDARYPSAAELTPSETLSAAELSGDSVPTVMLNLPVAVKVALRATRSETVSFSGAKLCALLCRFTL